MSPRHALGLVTWLSLLTFATPESALAQRGYILNPSGNDTTRQTDPEGMSHIRKTRRRSPTGFLYPYPLEPQALHPIGEGWLAGGSVELGGIAVFGDENETRFSRYADWSQNFLIHSFDAVLFHEPRGLLAELRGGGVGRDDQYLGADLRWLGRARLRAEYSGLPRTYANDARTLYQGLGGDTLRLIPGLTPGANTDADLITALAAEDRRNLSVQRDETRVAFDAWPRSDTRLLGHFESQNRNGERPYGGSWLYAAGPNAARAAEIIVPVDDETYVAKAGLEFSRESLQINAGYDGSYYRNKHSQLTWDNPLMLSGVGASSIERGRFALAPENDFHNFHADLATRLPYAGRAVLTASWSRMTQDDKLSAPTVNSGLVGGLDLDLWNTRAALPRGSAKARVETLLLSGDLNFRPWKRLRIGARVRYFDRDNETRYTARNPLTDEFGYVAEDGALAAGFARLPAVPIANPTAAEDFRYRSTPYGYDQLEIQGRADVTLPAQTRLAARYAWEHKGYAKRERSSTDEHRARLTLSTRVHARSNLRLGFRYANRGGGSYDYDPYDAYYISGLPGGPTERAFTLAQLRKSDLANREQHEVEVRWNLLLQDDMDLGLTGRFRDEAYGSEFGLQNERSASLSADWSYTPSQDLSTHLMGSWEYLERRQSNINDNPFGPPPVDPNAGGPGYPFANRWELDSDQNSFFGGAGFTWRFLSRITLESSYRVIYTQQELDYDFASLGALSRFPPVADAGSRFPDLKTLDHVLSSSLRVELTEHAAVRVFHYFQRGEVDDFQQRGLDNPDLLVATGVLFLGHRDRDYSAHVVGATVQLRFF